MADATRTFQAVDSIENTIDTAAYGCRNEDPLRDIEAQLFAIKCDRSDPYILEKASDIETDAEILYSPRKAEKHGGSENVKSRLYGYCQSIRTRASSLAAQTMDNDD